MESDQRATATERAFVRAFVRRDQRPRLLALLDANRRAEFVQRLAHQIEFVPARIMHLPRELQTPHEVSTALLELGAPSRCYVISEDASIDGQTMALDEALAATIATGFGTILICRPERLAFYEGEGPHDRLILASSAAGREANGSR